VSLIVKVNIFALISFSLIVLCEILRRKGKREGRNEFVRLGALLGMAAVVAAIVGTLLLWDCLEMKNACFG